MVWGSGRARQKTSFVFMPHTHVYHGMSIAHVYTLALLHIPVTHVDAHWPFGRIEIELRPDIVPRTVRACVRACMHVYASPVQLGVRAKDL